MIYFFIYFVDNAGVIVNPKGEMKGECLLFRYIFYYTLLEVPACIKKTKRKETMVYVIFLVYVCNTKI